MACVFVCIVQYKKGRHSEISSTEELCKQSEAIPIKA